MSSATYARFLLLVLVAAGIFGVTALLAPAHSQQPRNLPDSSSVSSVPGLVLDLSLNGTSLSPGQGITVTVSERSTLSGWNNLDGAERWAMNLGLGRCTPNYPFGVALVKGYYTLQNVSQGEELLLHPPVMNYMCVRPAFITNYYHFLPGSNQAVVQVAGGNETVTAPMQSSVTIRGHWAANGVFTPLEAGSYTVVAGDEWGALTVLHFTVG